MKITHPRAILCVYDFLISDEYSSELYCKYPGSSMLYSSVWGGGDLKLIKSEIYKA